MQAGAEALHAGDVGGEARQLGSSRSQRCADRRARESRAQVDDGDTAIAHELECPQQHGLAGDVDVDSGEP